MAEIKKSHPLFIRLTHWLNFPLLAVMIWSGILIYWANDVYWPKIPDGFYETLGLDHKLAQGMATHFFFMWLFVVNGLIYFIYSVVSGYAKRLIPFDPESAVGKREAQSSGPRYSPAQKTAYIGASLLALGLTLTGVAIYKPVQLSGLTNFLGGYENARFFHYTFMQLMLVFIFVHLFQVARYSLAGGARQFSSIVAGSVKRAGLGASYVVLFLFFFSVSFAWLEKQEGADGISRPLRRILELNEQGGMWLLDPARTLAFKKELGEALKGKNGRPNGDIGIDTPVDLAHWSMIVQSPIGAGRGPAQMTLTMNDIKKLPRTEILTQFKCIEGWSEMMSFAGVRFSDLLNHYHFGTHSGGAAGDARSFQSRKPDLFSYVGLETPDGQYYVSVDMKSMMNPDTLLAYEMNGLPLTTEHGAPLRLVVPNKYGVKSLKRIGKIYFSDHKLPDYWGEQGYDWFIGL